MNEKTPVQLSQTDETNDKPYRAAPLALWRTAEAFLSLLYNLFGAPEDVAAAPIRAPKAHALLLAWLRAGEALMRRLLLIEASAYPRPNSLPVAARARTKRARQLRAFYADQPEAWRVSFRSFHLRRRRPRRRGSAAATPRRFRDCWPLAERYEALIRVFNAPAPFAQRLARRLHAAPERMRDLLQAPHEKPRKSGDPAQIPDMVGRESWGALNSAAANAAHQAFDSS